MVDRITYSQLQDRTKRLDILRYATLLTQGQRGGSALKGVLQYYTALYIRKFFNVSGDIDSIYKLNTPQPRLIYISMCIAALCLHGSLVSNKTFVGSADVTFL